MQEVLGDLFDQGKNALMPEHTLSQRRNVKTMCCQELVYLCIVLAHLEFSLKMVLSKTTGNLQSNTVPQKKVKKGAN